MEKLVKLNAYENVTGDAKERLLFAIFAFGGGGIIVFLRILNDTLLGNFYINIFIALTAVSFIVL